MISMTVLASEAVVNIMVMIKNTNGYGGVCNLEYRDGSVVDEPQEDFDINRTAGGTGEKVYSYPNPFVPSEQEEVTIVFESSKQESLEILVYNVKGQVVWRTSTEAYVGRNIVKWDGQEVFGRKLSNGLYFIFVVNGEKRVVYKGRMCAVE